MKCEWNFNFFSRFLFFLHKCKRQCALPGFIIIIFSFYRYEDVRSPLPQSISQMSLYNNNTSGNVYQQASGIIEPLPFHHNHRPVPIPPSTRSLISDYNPTCKLLISDIPLPFPYWLIVCLFELIDYSSTIAYENLDGNIPTRPPRNKSWHVNVWNASIF